MRGEPSISPIWKQIPSGRSPEDEMAIWGRAERLRREAWAKLGIVVVKPDQLPPHLAAEIQAWAEQVYGRR